MKDKNATAVRQVLVVPGWSSGFMAGKSDRRGGWRGGWRGFKPRGGWGGGEEAGTEPEIG